MKVLRLLLIAGISIASFAVANAQNGNGGVEKKNNWIYLCMGSSSMMKYGTLQTKDANSPKIVIRGNAANGAGNQNLSSATNKDEGLNMFGAFGKTISEHKKDGLVTIVPIVIDNAPLKAFTKSKYKEYVDTVKSAKSKEQLAAYGNYPYESLVRMAKEEQSKGVIKGILFQSYQNDKYNDEWIAEVKKLYYDFVKDLSLDSTKVAILINELPHTDQGGNYAKQNQYINKVHDKLQYAFAVSSKAATLISDKTDFTSEGYRAIGKKFGIKTLQSQGYEVSDYHKSSTEPQRQVLNVKALEVAVQISDKGMLYATSPTALNKIEVKLLSNDQLIDTIVLQSPSEKTEFDLNKYPQAQLNIYFYGVDGSSQSFTINN